MRKTIRGFLTVWLGVAVGTAAVNVLIAFTSDGATQRTAAIRIPLLLLLALVGYAMIRAVRDPG